MTKRAQAFAHFLGSASALALMAAPGVVFAQEADNETEPTLEQQNDNEILVTGIRASLAQAMNIKRDAQGVVDAISAVDIG